MAHRRTLFVGSAIGRYADETPEETAIRCGPRRLTWRSVSQKIEQVAAHLAPYGRSARFALLIRDPVELLIAFFACARAGQVAMVMDPDWPASLQTRTIAQASPDLVLRDGDMDRLRRSAQVPVAIDVPDGSDLFYAGFTSGSTGVPKGYVRAHRSWLKSFDLSAAEFGIGRSDQVFIPGNMVHSLHLYGAVQALSAGAEVVFAPRFSPKAIVADLRLASSAVLYATPTQLHYLGEEIRQRKPAFSVRLILASGAKWADGDRAQVQLLFPQARLVEFYGASEMSFVTLSCPEDNVPAGSVGRAAAGVEIAIGDPADPLPPGETGLIWVRSGLLFSGYICGGGSELRWQDGWLTVGDLGFLDEKGFLFLKGREQRMIVTSGLNVYAEEVEAVLRAQPAVRDAAVFGVPDAVRGCRIEAAIIAVPQKANGMDLPSMLRTACLEQLDAGKAPRAFHFFEAFPLTPGGKTDLKALENLVVAAQERRP